MKTHQVHNKTLFHKGLPVFMTLFLSCLTLQVAAQTPLVGSLGGSVAVGSDGLASYSIPIEVVPGTCGVQPQLAVTYSSAGGRGLLGSCWTLTGLPSVARTPRTAYYDGDMGSVNFDAGDRYELDGERLVRLSSSTVYAATGAVYGKEVEDFTRVTLCGVPDTASQYFTAVTADKRRTLARAAALYLRKLRDKPSRVRFDVVEVVGRRDSPSPPVIRHIQNAFTLPKNDRLPL